MVKRQFTAVYKKTGKWFSAWVEEVPGVNTQGETKEEARENLEEALGLILETNHKLAMKKGSNVIREVMTVLVPA